jgi:hypothetical protein
MSDTEQGFIPSLKVVLALLNKIERTYASQRSEALEELQNIIWDEPALENERLYFLQDLAGDLNFYEPVERDRDKDLGYYDDNRLLELTGAAIKEVTTILNTGNGG